MNAVDREGLSKFVLGKGSNFLGTSAYLRLYRCDFSAVWFGEMGKWQLLAFLADISEQVDGP